MTTKEKIETLSRDISAERYAKMLHALNNRTHKIAVALEDIFQPHNAAAVMRSCDAFGIQNAFIIENRYPLRISHNVDMGASKWMSVRRFKSRTCAGSAPFSKRPPNEFDAENTRRAIAEIKNMGYTVAASTLSENSIDISEVPVDRPIAILIGTELTGLSKTAHECADIAFKMDMLGFAQSLNLSVFSALCISELSRKMRALNDSWKMSEAERDELLLHWLSI